MVVPTYEVSVPRLVKILKYYGNSLLVDPVVLLVMASNSWGFKTLLELGL